MNFGELVYVCDSIELYHIHSYYDISEKFKLNQIISTIDFPKRESYNAPKKFREEEFEKIRLRSYNEFPSRSNCLFAIEKFDIETWSKRLYSRKPHYQLLKIELLDGKLTKLDDAIYESNGNETNDELALYFWSGCDVEENSKPVILFEGRFKVVEVILQGINTLNQNE